MKADHDIRTRIEATPGLRDALVALSYFRHRHDQSPRFKKSKRHADLMVGHYGEWVRIAREYIRGARKAGWRGSIKEAAMR